MSRSVRSTRTPHTTRVGRLILCQDFNSRSSLMSIFRASTRQRQKSSSNRHIKSVRTPGRLGTTSRSNSPSCRPIYRSNVYGPVTQGKTRVGQLINRRDWFCDCGRISARECNSDCKRTYQNHLDQVTGTELESEIPSHAQNDDLLVKVPSLEQILCRGRFRHPGRYRKMPRLSTVCTRTLEWT